MRIESFIGQARTSIDAKGRTAFPREFRRFLTEDDGQELVISLGPNNCLFLYTVKEWNQFMLELESRPRTEKNELFISILKANSFPCELDGQNRIFIPSVLRNRAQIQNDVVFAPQRGKTASLWNPQRYDALYGLNTPEQLAAFDAGFWSGSSSEAGH
ncbi:MAG TPA: MraZ family transcriptional regulator [Fibrobacteraceae bacterium]|nr:MraZ family transcriptional regulator [Fibrobacteraceae bacterium]